MRPNFHEINANHSAGLYSQQQLKIKRDSHVIKKPTSSSPLSAAASAVPPSKPRRPVIIYAHTPKIIKTEEKDFRALVQKLTGMPGSEEELAPTTPPHSDNRDIISPPNHSPDDPAGEIEKNKLNFGNNHNAIGAHSKSSSMATIDAKIEELGLTDYSMFDHHSLPAPAPPPLQPPLPIYDSSEFQSYMSAKSLFESNPADNLLYGNQYYLDFDFDSESSIFESNMGSSFSSPSEFGSLTDFCDI